jgi:hypothetical protein
LFGPLSVLLSPGAGASVAKGPLKTVEVPEAGLVEQATVVQVFDCVKEVVGVRDFVVEAAIVTLVEAATVTLRGPDAAVVVLPTVRDPALTCEPSTPSTACETVIARVPGASVLVEVIEKDPSAAIVPVPAATPST